MNPNPTFPQPSEREEGPLRRLNHTIDMIEREDLSHWSDAHDRITLLALREYRDVWCAPSPQKQNSGDGK